MAAQKTTGSVLKEYFGYQPADPSKSGMTLADAKALPYEQGVAIGGMKGFAVELGRLSPEEKLELARGAAKELGLKQEDVDFQLV